MTKRNVAIMLIMVLVAIFCLSGCAKVVNERTQIVNVTVVDTYHRAMYTTMQKIGKTTTTQVHPAVYRVYVEYNGEKYTISGAEAYREFKDKEGEVVKAELEITTYDNGNVVYDINKLISQD